MPDRVVVFLDYQNVYYDARETFHTSLSVPSQLGQIHPVQLGQRLAARQPDRELTEVRVYRGRPDATRDPKGYGAARRQQAAWEAAGARVFPRTLRYPRGWPNEPAEEKGVDVALAVDFVMMAATGAYDVGILMSTDTDLRPALEAVLALERPHGTAKPQCEVATWSSPDRPTKRLSISRARVWCHFLGLDDYRAVADARDYAR